MINLYQNIKIITSIWKIYYLVILDVENCSIMDSFDGHLITGKKCFYDGTYS